MSNSLIKGEIVNVSTSPNYIRPDYTVPYLPKETSTKFFSWVNVNIPNEEFKTPKMHYMMIDELIGPDSGTDVQAMVHREGAKTTVLSKFLPLYIASTGELPNFGKVLNCIIFSATYDQAVDLLKDIRSAWENSEVMQETIFLAKNKMGKIIADTEKYICFENEKGDRIHIQAKGAGQSMRGTKKDGKRPELMIFDDILVDAIMTSKEERVKLKRWYYSSVVPACNTAHNKKIVVGTPMTDDDLLSEMLRSKTYKSIKFPIADRFPVPENEIISSWKDYHTPAKIMKAYREAKEMGAEGDFFREKMLEVVNDEMRIFPEDCFSEYRYVDLKESGNMDKMHFFTTLDLAVSTRKHADFTVIITIGVNGDGHWFIVKIDVGRFNPSEVISKLFDHIKKFRPMNTRAEKASLQQVLDHFIQLEMMKTGVYFAYEGLENNSILSKEYRITSLQPMMKMKKIHFPTDIDQDALAELTYEMKGYIKTGPTSAHDDAVDCLANFLDPDFVIVPTKEKAEEYNGDGNFDDLFNDNDRDDYDY